MGGRIGVESTLGRGQHVLVRGPAAGRDRATRRRRSAILEGLDVLIVDDNATNREILERRLASWRMRAETASGGAGGPGAHPRAARPTGQPYDLVLLDHHMPGLDGLGVARAIGGGGPKVILLSSAGRTRGGPGVHATLTKPVRDSRLYDAIATAMTGAAPAPKSEPEPEPARDGASILLAEDNPTNQAVAINILRRRGYRVDVASHGGEAVDALRRETYAAVLMDCQMPVLDGYAATAEIRRLEGTARRTPIIAMTAHAMEGDRERCIAAGMDDYLSKPLDAHALDAVLQRWVGDHRGDRDRPRGAARAGPRRRRRGDRRGDLRRSSSPRPGRGCSRSSAPRRTATPRRCASAPTRSRARPPMLARSRSPARRPSWSGWRARASSTSCRRRCCGWPTRWN